MESVCNACPRRCGVPRPHGLCGADDQIHVAHYMKHMWEEPFISGTNGSGAVFLAGCNLGCVYCQNAEISAACRGKSVTDDRLHAIFDELITQGAHNINLVTPSHYITQIARLLRDKKPPVPLVYNCSGYEGDLDILAGLVDVYLADFKYADSAVAARYSNAPDYPDVCLKALGQMYNQVGDYVIEGGIMRKGLVIRHLVLPSNIDNSLDVIDALVRFVRGKKVKISLMGQYLPHGRAVEFPEINRPLTDKEYRRVVNYALRRGLTDTLVQDLEAADNAYIPKFTV